MENFFTQSTTSTASALKTDLKNGLTSKEAKKRLCEHGANIISERKKPNIFVKFLSQFNDFMVMILLGAAAISFITSVRDGQGGVTEPIIILGIVILNTFLGVFQERRAEKSLETLKKLTVSHATVIRDGKKTEIPASDVTIGDLLVLEVGDVVAADARITESDGLETDESGLTGESVSILKTAKTHKNESLAPGDRTNMVMASTAVTAGRGRAIVTDIGMNTEVGKIAGLLINTAQPLTPLQKRLSQVGKLLGIFALFVCGLVFFLGVLKKIPPLEMFITSVSLAVAAIPEGLPAIITIMLAVGVRKMASFRAVVKSLPSVETLGSATVICTDKTGTLTQNKMTIEKIFSTSNERCLKNAVLCCDFDTKNATEKAILDFAERSGTDVKELFEKNTAVGRLAFTSTRKMMSVLLKGSDGWRIVTKGAPDRVLTRCTHIEKDGKIVTLDAKTREKIKSETEKMAQNALRVICIAEKSFSSKPDKIQEENLVFTGLFGMADPPRHEARSAVLLCKEAGIRPVMITGDHIKTAKAVAEKTGICDKFERCLSGTELDLISDSSLLKKVTDFDVFARVTPFHKLRIVKAFQARGEIVAMTGDGVNDAPALRAADIGCCPGKIGTDVAREASDMIMTDDNFATIVEAVRQGRIIFANIRKSIRFLLSSNLGEIITVFGCLLFSGRTPLCASALLWVNLVTDSFPATALCANPPDDDIMNGQKNNKLFDKILLTEIFTEGTLIGFLTILGYILGGRLFGNFGGPEASAVAFCVLSISQLVHVFNVRSEQSVFKVGFLKNKYLVASFILGITLQISAVSIPAFSKIFEVAPLNAKGWVLTAILSSMPLVVCELQKKVISNCKSI